MPWLTKELARGSAGILRDGKGGTWEAGFRVPAIAHWPGVIEEGRVSMEIVSTLDLLPTFLSIVGAELPLDREFDGMDISSHLRKDADSPRNLIHYYRGSELYAVRMGSYKAHFQTFNGYSRVPPEKHDPPLLFHLGQDPSENFNVAEKHPEILAEIIAEADRHRRSIVPGLNQIHRGKQ